MNVPLTLLRVHSWILLSRLDSIVNLTHQIMEQRTLFRIAEDSALLSPALVANRRYGNVISRCCCRRTCVKGCAIEAST